MSAKNLYHDVVIDNLQEALGQYELYRMVLQIQEPERALYMAVHQPVYDDVFTEKLGRLVLSEASLKLLVFQPKEKRITKWID